MLLIIISWIYILFTTINLGFALDKIMRLKNRNFVITSILGLFSVTILASLWAVFDRINIEFQLFILLVNILLSLKYKTEILLVYTSFLHDLKILDKKLQFFLGILFLLIIAQCSSIPNIIDNESYYIQTIKWINEYGFVKGLANLHIFFGQVSGWHIAQSAFNFSFLYKNLNDLSGFCLLLGNVFATVKLNEYFSNSNKNYLIIGLLPLANVYFFQLISAPSPDLPIYIFVLISFFYFIESLKNCSISTFNLISLLILFVLYIKISSFALVVIPILILVFNLQKLSSKIVPIAITGLLVLLLFIVKNTIITGFPLYPTTYLQFGEFDYRLPKNVISFFFNDAQLKQFFITSLQFHSMTGLQIAFKWLFLPNIDGFFNLLTITLMVISPFFIYNYFNKKSVWLIYLVAIFQMVLLLISSPQFRFFMHLTLFLSFLIFACWFTNRKIILAAYALTTTFTVVILFIPIHFNSLKQNKFTNYNTAFSMQTLIFPYGNSKNETLYKSVVKGNLQYNSSQNNSFFWGTGNGELPCVNEKQLNYLEKYLGVFPQLRTTDLKDGFYSKKVTANE